MVAGFATLVGILALPAQADDARTLVAAQQRQAMTAPVADRNTLPDGWRYLRRSAELQWRSDVPIPIGDAAVEFWWGQTRLGEARPLPDGRTFTLEVATLPAPDLSSLRVTRGGVPIGDDAQPAERAGRSPDAAAAAAAVQRRFASRPLASSDPGEPGPFAVTSSTYRLDPLAIDEYSAPVEMVGRVVRPTDASGARPLVVFLHGRHGTCYKGRHASGDWPCPTGWKPIPSYLGYLDAQKLLASQGFVTVSISANGVNGQDWQSADGGAEARSLLVREHLRYWDEWSTTGGNPFGSDLVGAVDLGRVVLVGHSRGGEGVNRAAIDSVGDPRWSIAGQVLIGPTAFGRQSLPGLDTVVLLPFCDGDVSDLQGQQYVDQSRDVVDDTDRSLRSAVMVMGANHNFFNSEWTPGESRAPSFDDWWSKKDPVCGRSSDQRLSPEDQRRVGSTYIAAAAHVFAEGNREELGLIDGSGLRAPSAAPAVVDVTAIGARRDGAYRPAADDAVSAAGEVTSRVCQGWGGDLPTCARRQSSPHFLPMTWERTDPAPVAWEASWSDDSGRAEVRLSQPVDLSKSRALELRVAPDHERRSRFVVRIVDGNRAHHDLGVADVSPLPSTRAVSHLWAQTVRLPLAGSSIDLAAVERIVLVPQSRTGHVYVLDAHGRRPGLSEVSSQDLPRVDVVDAEVLEGDGGTHTVDLRVAVQGTITTAVTLWMTVRDESGQGSPTSQIVTLSPGDTFVDVPVEVEGDQRDDLDLTVSVTVRALREAVTGHYLGTLRVLDDDPASQASVTPTASAVEGEPLRWTISLDRPSDVYVSFGFKTVPPDPGTTEMLTNDLRPRWLADCARVPKEPKPLSQVRFYCADVTFRPGVTERALALPTRPDARTEGEESVVWKLAWGDPSAPDPPWRLVGSVTDPA